LSFHAGLFALSGRTRDAKDTLQLLLTDGALVDLVPKNDKRNVLQFFAREETLHKPRRADKSGTNISTQEKADTHGKLLLRFRETLYISCINNVNNAVSNSEVAVPEATS
jgi:hypothetical protein